MKKQLAILGALALSSSAFAVTLPPIFGNDNCDVCAQDIKLNAPTIQNTTLVGGSSSATASGTDSRAANNMSSNTYGVLIKAQSTQTTDMNNSTVQAIASGRESSASNNFASNIGAVGVGATQSQYVKASYQSITARASGSGSTAVQNFSSNNACLSCQ